MRPQSLLSTVMMLALAALVTRAEATRMFAGSQCQIFTPAQITGIPRYDFAGLSNDASLGGDFLTVICPVVRDNTTSTTGTAAFKVGVVSNRTDDVVCTLYSLDENGVVVDTNTDITNSAVPVTLDVAVNVSANKGYYNMVCQLPPGATLLNYRLKE